VTVTRTGPSPVDQWEAALFIGRGDDAAFERSARNHPAIAAFSVSRLADA